MAKGDTVLPPQFIAQLAQIGERLNNTVAIQNDTVHELHELKKQVNGNGKKGLQDMIEDNTRQIADIVLWKKASDKAKENVKTENRRYIWAIIIMAFTSISTTVGNIIIAFFTSKGTIP